MRGETSLPLWRNRDFLLIWSGQALSLLGTQVSTFALPLLVLALTRSPFQAGLVSTVQRMPYLLLSLPIGAFIDRWNRKSVMLLADSARFLVYASLPIAYLFAPLTIIHLYLIALVGGLALVLFDIADGAAFPRVVSIQHLPTAAALMEGTSAAADLLGPGIGGFLIGLAPTVLAGAALAYLIDSLSYLVSVFGLAMIRTPFQAENTKRNKVALRQEILTGFRFLWTHTRLRFLTLLSTCVNLFVGSTPLAVIILARNELHIPVLTLGLIFTVGGVGGIIGAIFVPWLKKLISIGQILISSMVLWIVSVILLALAPLPLLLIVGWIIFTLASPIYFATSFAYRVTLVPDELQGRVNSIYRTFSQTGYALGGTLGGLLLNLLNARQTLWLIALGLLLSLGLIVLTELRHA